MTGSWKLERRLSMQRHILGADVAQQTGHKEDIEALLLTLPAIHEYETVQAPTLPAIHEYETVQVRRTRERKALRHMKCARLLRVQTRTASIRKHLN